jgi:aconitate hydratase
MTNNPFKTLKDFKLASGKTGRLPVSIRIVLESVLRNCDGKKVTEEHVEAARQLEAQRRPHRRDPLRAGAHRAAGLHRRAAAGRPGRHAQRRAGMGKNPKTIEPLVPVDLVVDHSVQIDHYGSKDALDLNMKLEFSATASATSS